METFASIIDLLGNVLMEEHLVEADRKYEGSCILAPDVIGGLWAGSVGNDVDPTADTEAEEVRASPPPRFRFEASLLPLASTNASGSRWPGTHRPQPGASAVYLVAANPWPKIPAGRPRGSITYSFATLQMLCLSRLPHDALSLSCCALIVQLLNDITEANATLLAMLTGTPSAPAIN